MTPLISVIIPVYNVEDYLDPCLASIVAQTYSNLEIIVVDDGSTDGSGAIGDRWAERDSRIRVIHQDNGGLSAARNTGLDAMSGKLVIMVDSDDVLHPEAIKILLTTLQEYNADVVIPEFKSFYGNDVEWSETTQSGRNPRHYDGQGTLMAIYYQHDLSNSSCGRLFDASLFDGGVRFPDGQYYEDLAIVYPLYQHCKHAVKIDDMLYGYRQRANSILGQFSPKRAHVIDICEQLERHVQQDNPALLPAVRSRLLSACFNILLLSSQDDTGQHRQLADRCWEGIKRLRHQCLTDRHVRLKNKAGIIASYLGRSFLCNVIGRKYHPKR